MARLADLIREGTPDSQNGGALSPELGSSALNSDRSWCVSTRQELWKIREVVRSSRIPSLTGCTNLVGQLVQLLNHSDELVRWALNGQTEDYVLDNALHVAVLAAKVGMGLQYSQQNLERLVLAGLLHDIGMWTLPVSLVEKRDALSEEERDILRTHPERGRRILAAQGSVFECVSAIIAQEHERCDGSGYPCRLKDGQITESALVVGMVDTLDAMVTLRPYRKRLTPHQGVRELLLHAKTTFSLPVLKALGDQITLYPIGTDVRLNTGEHGTVTKVNSRYPLRPVVTISTLGGASDVDLSRCPSAHIVEALQGRSVQ